MNLSERIGGHIRANVIGYLALFVALTGTSYAASKITSKQIAKNAITSKLIKDGQVASADVADNGLTGTDINESTLNGIQGPAGALGPQGPAGPSGQSTGPAGGDLSASYPNPQIAAGSITDADIALAAAIDDAKLGTINDPGKVADTALSSNVARLNQSQTFTAGKTFSGPITTALNVSDAGIGTALDIGDNDVIASGATISAAELARLDGEAASPIRTLHLPLLSFINPFDNELLDFTVSDGTAPDFVTFGSEDSLAIEWDDDTDGAGLNVGDSKFVATSFTVPPDYLSGNIYVLRMSKDTHTNGQLEEMQCASSINNGSYPLGGVVDIGTTTLSTYVVSGGNTPAAGDTVNVHCFVHDQLQPFGQTDDVVRLQSIAWRYTASQ